jgi:hypothetical protein
MTKLIQITIFLSISLIANSQDYCDFIQNVQNYQDSVILKYNGDCDVIDSETFDINTYLSSFDKIDVEKDYKIGVYFFDNFLDGKPYLYALKNDQVLNDRNKRSLYKYLNQPEISAKNHIVPNDSDEGFLQYLFFHEMGDQFALKWHSNYNEKFIICTKKKLEEVINEFKKCNQPQTGENETETPAFQVDLQELNKLTEINPNVEIELTNEFCTITWIEDRTHIGIYKCKYKIQRQFPYKIERINEEQILKITIGFFY